MIIDATLAVTRLRPGVMVNMVEQKIVTWESDTPPPTSQEINAEIERLTAAEPMRLLRVERNRRLAETDWWASADLTMTDEQKAYRQSLRDLPSVVAVKNPVWPVDPTA